MIYLSDFPTSFFLTELINYDIIAKVKRFLKVFCFFGFDWKSPKVRD